MSLLLILLPSRPRLSARGAGEAVPRLPASWPYVYSSDGLQPTQTGQAAAELLPRAGRTVLVLPEGSVAWHRVSVPKAPPARLRAALAGVMEDALLDDDEGLHLALGPGAVAGATGWVAVTHKRWLADALATLEAAGVAVEQAVAMAQPLPPGPAAGSAPAPAARGHFYVAADGDGAEATWLSLASADGAVVLALNGSLARSLAAEATGSGEPVVWTATPAAAAAAEQWLGAPVALLGEAERGLQAAREATGLRQFDLLPRRRATRLARGVLQRLTSPEWRVARWGLVALLALQLVGLNAYAWQQRQRVVDQRAAMTGLLQQAHPSVRTVLDAPLQMQRETERLRAAAGRAGGGDLEVLLGAAASAWPEGLAPAQTLRFEAGRLTLSAPGLGAAQVEQMRQRLRGAGYEAQWADGRLSIFRSAS